MSDVKRVWSEKELISLIRVQIEAWDDEFAEESNEWVSSEEDG